MAVLNLQQYPPPAATARVIAFTTPQNYAGRLSHLIHLKGWAPLWCPTVTVEPTPQTISAIQHYLLPPNPPLHHFSAVAFTSRTGITAFAQALSGITTPPLSPDGDIFTVSALGKDAELLDESLISRLCEKSGENYGFGSSGGDAEWNRRGVGIGDGEKGFVPCPSRNWIGRAPVVPKFMGDLDRRGWVAVRVNAYETRWRSGVAKLVEMMEEECGVDAIVFTSTAEVEGAVEELGGSWVELGNGKGNVPTDDRGGARPGDGGGSGEVGVEIDVVSSRFDSFDGVVDALKYGWRSFEC